MLHPYLGIAWFRRAGADRATQAEVLFEHAFNRYQEAHPAPPPPIKTGPRAGNKFANFLDGVCMMGVADSDPIPEVGEYDRYLKAAETSGRGSQNTPLEWWKVCLHGFI